MLENMNYTFIYKDLNNFAYIFSQWLDVAMIYVGKDLSAILQKIKSGKLTVHVQFLNKVKKKNLVHTKCSLSKSFRGSQI